MSAVDPPILFRITGFGAFAGEPHNPSSALIRRLRRSPPQWPDFPRGPGIFLEALKIFEVSGVGALQDYFTMRNSLEPISSPVVVWLHLGVARSSRKIRLERRCENLADFRVADERGWQPKNQKILKHGSEHLYSNIPLDSLYSSLTSHSPDSHDFLLSDSCGEFLCNFLYYHSLAEILRKKQEISRNASATGKSSHSPPLEYVLFIHIPPFEVLNEENQLARLKEIIINIREILVSNNPSSMAADDQKIPSSPAEFPSSSPSPSSSSIFSVEIPDLSCRFNEEFHIENLKFQESLRKQRRREEEEEEENE